MTMTDTDIIEFSRPIRVSKLNNSADQPFDEAPNEGEAKALEKLLNVLAVRKMRFQGRLIPLDKTGWELVATLGVTVTQSCVVTLESVRTRIDVDVRRQFFPLETSYEEELEIPDNDEIEDLGAFIDLGVVAMEALVLALPEYPRAAGAELENANFTAPNVVPITEEDVKPFAGLAALKEKLEGND